MLKYLKKILGVPDIKVYELPNNHKPNLAIPIRSGKGVGFTVPTQPQKKDELK